MPIPNADNAVIEQSKICDYLLNESHPEGSSKAAWFVSLGYSLAEWSLLADDLLAIAQTCNQYDSETNAFGVKYRATGTVGRPGYRPAVATTVWITESNNVPRLVTAFPEKSK